LEFEIAFKSWQIFTIFIAQGNLLLYFIKNKEMKIYVSLLLTVFSIFSFSNIKAQINPDSILIKNEKRPKVLLVGTFHFAYYNEDLFKVNKKDQVDVLSSKRQKEVLELVDYIAKFKPNKIFVEDFNKDNILMTNYKNYKTGKYNLIADEIDQIAYRLLDKFQLDTIYGVDARTIGQDLYKNDSTKNYIKTLQKDIDNETISPALAKYFEWYEKDNKYKVEHSLLDYFKQLNSDKYQQRGFYSLFVTYFKNKKNGADNLTLDLLSRNIRILHKISQNITSEEDRILILFGSGHTEFFNVFFGTSPEHELIKFNNL
jgi:hypothetical protein